MCALPRFAFSSVGATRSAVIRVTPPWEGQGEALFLMQSYYIFFGGYDLMQSSAKFFLQVFINE